jgi:plastocyanin
VFVQRLRFAFYAAVFLAFLGASGAEAQSAITMTAMEFAFQPPTATVSSGTVTFTLRNTGEFPHNIRIEGMAADVLAENVTAGQTASGRVSLAPGTYTFWCPVGMHRERGMEGTLTVASVAAGRAGGFDPIMATAALGALGAVTLAAGLLRRRARA